MQMWMMLQSLAPGVEHRQKPDPGTQTLGVGGDLPQGFRGGPEENPVDDGLVLIRQGRDLLRDTENDMKVLDRQQFSLPLGEPLLLREGLALGTMAIAAGVIADA